MKEHRQGKSMSRLRAWIEGHLQAIRTGIHPRTRSFVEEGTDGLRSDIHMELRQQFMKTTSQVEQARSETQNRVDALDGRIQELESSFRQLNDRIDLEIKKVLTKSESRTITLIRQASFVVDPSKVYPLFLGKIDLRLKTNARIVGSLNATGGAGNDINFYVVDERNYAKFSAGKSYSTLEYLDKVSSVALNVPITHGGGYYLLFDNTFSWVSPKTVSVTVSLSYETLSIWAEQSSVS